MLRRLSDVGSYVAAGRLAVVLWILGEALESARTNEELVLEREQSLLRQATHDPLTGLSSTP